LNIQPRSVSLEEEEEREPSPARPERAEALVHDGVVDRSKGVSDPDIRRDTEAGQQRLPLQEDLLLGVPSDREVDLVADAGGGPVDVQREAAAEPKVGVAGEG